MWEMHAFLKLEFSDINQGYIYPSPCKFIIQDPVDACVHFCKCIPTQDQAIILKSQLNNTTVNQTNASSLISMFLMIFTCGSLAHCFHFLFAFCMSFQLSLTHNVCSCMYRDLACCYHLWRQPTMIVVFFL